MKTPHGYQQALIDRAQDSTALFWDMGLGKTITALEVYKKSGATKLFVLSPLSMIDEWCREFESQVGGSALPYKKAVKNGLVGLVDCLVLNYEMVWRLPSLDWITSEYMIICDESHRIKNPQSKIGKCMKVLREKTQYKIILTGTPQSQGYIDYYNQLYFLGKINMSFTEFKKRYCRYGLAEFNGVKIQQLIGYQNTDEFDHRYLSQCEFLKIERVYDEVIKYNKVKIDVTQAYKRALKDKVIYFDTLGAPITDRKVIDEYLATGSSEVVKDYKMLDSLGAFRSGLRMLLNSDAKLDWLREKLEDYDRRVVIFYNFNCELRSLKKLLEKMGRPYSEYNGAVKDFTNFKKYTNGVCLCNYGSGSVGINDLVISNLFIAYSPTDNYVSWEQSKKRIDRQGQVNTPVYYFLESGLETRIYNSLENGKDFDDKTFQMELERGLI